MAWFVQLVIGILLNVVAALLTPRPKREKPDAAKDVEDPVAEAGKPIPVVFGSMTVKGLNILYFGDKRTHERKVKAGNSKK